MAATLRKDACCELTIFARVSNYGQEADRCSRDVGFDHHLVKPVSFDAFGA